MKCQHNLVESLETPMRFVFQIRIKPGKTLDEYVEAWKRGSVIIQQMAGARGTKLHRAVGDPRLLLAIAEWDSKEARDLAMQKLRNDSDPMTKDILGSDLEFGDFSLVGEFEEAEWSVDPDNAW